MLSKICILISVVTLTCSAAETAEVLFQKNCAACHLMDQSFAGPSLIEVGHLYRNNPQGIVAWAMKPGNKRKGNQMPPMAHLGKENLKAISEYILKATKGKKWTKTKELTKKSKVSRIQRMFLPNAGPAAIAVRLNETLSFCWDAGACRLRYLWQGAYMEPTPYWKGNGNGLAKILGKVYFRTEAFPFSNGKDKPKLQFQGYAVEGGLPIFNYSIDGVLIQEKILGLKNGFSIHYKVGQTKGELSYKIPKSEGFRVSCEKVLIKDNLLKIPSSKSFEFTLIFKKEESK